MKESNYDAALDTERVVLLPRLLFARRVTMRKD